MSKNTKENTSNKPQNLKQKTLLPQLENMRSLHETEKLHRISRACDTTKWERDATKIRRCENGRKFALNFNC